MSIQPGYTYDQDCPKYIYRDSMGAMVGYIHLHPDGEIADIYVVSAHRRKGVATALYQYALSLHPDMHHSETRTIDGHMWAIAVGGDLPTWVGV